jgi:hypothetical protein
MSTYPPTIVSLCRVEWSSHDWQDKPCCPECGAPMKGNGSHMTDRGLQLSEPGTHFPHCLLDQAIRTEADLHTPEQREQVRQESYRIRGKGNKIP